MVREYPGRHGSGVLTAVYRAGIAWEERILERRWGEAWHEYAERTPRWLSFRSAQDWIRLTTRSVSA